MRASAEEGGPLALIIQRLMDADLLLPEEGSALLAEVEAFDQARDAASGEKASESSEKHLQMLEALLEADHLDASVAGQAKAIVHRILHGEQVEASINVTLPDA